MNVRDLVPWARNAEPSRSLAASREASPFLSLHREVNRLFDEVFRGFDASSAWSAGAFSPLIEVEENDREYRVAVELPGVEERDVEVLVHDGVLVLRGEKRSEIAEPGRALTERAYGRFERRLALDGVDENHLKAFFRNGVLTITAPKAQAGRDKVRRIPINQSGTTH